MEDLEAALSQLPAIASDMTPKEDQKVRNPESFRGCQHASRVRSPTEDLHSPNPLSSFQSA